MPLASLLLLVAVFFLCWFNRFAGIRSGAGELAGGLAVLAGKVPYRDYFNPGPPLNALKAALWMKLFGRTLLVLRLAGVVERLAIAAMLYRWLCRLVPRHAAWTASLVTIILSAGDRTDPLASYNHDAILFGMGAAMCLDLLLSTNNGKRYWIQLWLLFSAGIFISFSLLTKQTVGFGCFLWFAIWITLVLSGKSYVRAGVIPSIISISAGFGVPLVIISAWLWSQGALASWAHMNLVEGPAAKASSPLDFGRRMLLVVYDNAGWVTLGVFFLLLSLRPLAHAFRHEPEGSAEKIAVSIGILVPCAAFGVALAAALLMSFTHTSTLHDQAKSAVYYVLLALPLIGLHLFNNWRRKQEPSVRTLRLALFAGTGISIAATLSLSWPAFEAMLLPGLALPLALVLTYCRPVSRWYVLVLLVCAVYLQTREKLDLPFGFDYQVEAAVPDAVERSDQPLLRGELLPGATVRFLDGSVRLIQDCVGSGETVFTYPEMGLVYALSGVAPPTRSASHNMDVVNDTFARREAALLMKNPPRVLIYYSETEEQATGAERLWRRGKPAGQRELVQTIEHLLPQYTKVQTYQLRQGDPTISTYLWKGGEHAKGTCR